MQYGPKAPVERFALLKQTQGTLVGYAAPAGGPAPCRLILSAGETPIVVVEATSFCQDAARAGVRAGWCGFTVPGLAQAFAISDDVRLTCAASAKNLATVAFDADLLAGTGGQSRLTVSELLALARLPQTSPSLLHLMEFASEHLRRHGVRSFVERSYQTLLGRWPDASAAYDLPSGKTDDARALAYVSTLMESPEYAARWGEQIPGPFHPSFRYDKDMIG